MDDFLSVKVRKGEVNSYIRGYFECIDTPRSLACWLLYEAREHEQLVNLNFEPSSYKDPKYVALDFAATSFLKKYKGLKTGIDTEAVALKKFSEAEAVCEATNLRFRNLALDPQFKGANVWLLNAATRKIAKILGRSNVDELVDCGSWGPGATGSITGSDTSTVRKFRFEREITTRLYSVIKDRISEWYPNWLTPAEVLTLVTKNWSKVLTVTKNAKTDRTIAIEPGINSWFQKGLGEMIRRRLRRAGYDLDSDERNQMIAREGSLDNLSATIDFSAASDSIALEVVRELLPPDWFEMLSCCRTPYYRLPGSCENVPFSKFSSMGNGFTFELESLIFVVAAEAVTEYLRLDSDHISVFGDDITLDARAVHLYREFTRFLGFTVNMEKSFGSDSCFRESCGSYYFNGIDVKPYFLKERINDAKSIFRLANGITSVAHRHSFGYGRDIRFLPLHKLLIEKLPDSLKAIRGPITSGDICIASDFDEAVPTIARDGWEGYYHPAFVDVPVKRDSDSRGVLLSRLRYRSVDESSGNRYSLRRVTKVRYKKRILVAQWYSLGPWTYGPWSST